jgi:glycosyltransferase involved in cell wall biosynthesis
MNILYSPFENRYNKYIDISKNILEDCGCQIYEFDKKTIFNFNKKYDAVILNWYDSLSEKFIYKQIIIKKIKLLILKLHGTKIVFTFHNRLPHDTSKKNLNAALKYIKWICKHSDYIIYLSKSSKNYLELYMNVEEIKSKARYIPHPNYVGIYSEELKINKYPNNIEFNILFLGGVRPYKNIELIIEVAKELGDKKIKFNIIGNCFDETYKMTLLNQINDLPNVHFESRFVGDEEIDQLIRKNDILILPYDLKSSMNSGTAMLAFSNGRSVITPRISTIKEYDLNLTYSYEYNTREEHLLKLKEATITAYEDWKNNKLYFEEKGNQLLEAVKKYNSNKELKKCYMSLLDEIKEG